METVTLTEACYLLELSQSRLKLLLSLKRVKGAYKEKGMWKIPLYNQMPKIEEKKTRKGPKGTWRKRPRQAEKLIHVNQKVIRKNHKEGKNDPPITIKCGARNDYAHQVDILGPCQIVYRPHNKLRCGARLWIRVSPEVNVAVHNFLDLASNELSPDSSALSQK